jgi:peptidoglycan/xylan/chitin deacetylase (PgdA/CDA1 family)
MLSAAKQATLRLLRKTGIFHIARNSLWRTQHVAILGYHGVSLEDEHAWDPSLYMSPELFEQRLETVKRQNCTVLTLSDALGRLYARDLPPRSLVFTFDDGACDFLRQAHPRLQAYEYPATVYLSTYYCQYNKPVFHSACSYMLWRMRGRVAGAEDLLKGSISVLDLRTPSSRAETLRAIEHFAVSERLSGEGKNQLLEDLASLLGFDYRSFVDSRKLHLLNPREVAELSRRGVDFQLHTHRHRSPLDRDLFAGEIEENRRRILAMTGTSPSHFCYPCAYHWPTLLPWLAQLNVASATTCEPGLASPASNALLLPRVMDSNLVTRLSFEAWLSGVGRFIPRAPRPEPPVPWAEELQAELSGPVRR